MVEYLMALNRYTSIKPDVISKISQDRDEKSVKKILHQVWGMFFPSKLNYPKILKNVKERLAKGESLKDTFTYMMQFHSSTKERLSELDTFYKRIFEVTGTPKSILDIGCGFTPLSLPWMELPTDSSYLGIDIDQLEIDFFKELFTLFSHDYRVKFEVSDATEMTKSKKEYDLVLILKVLPVLDMVEKGSSLKLLRKLKAKSIVVSFPKKSVSGKEKGMSEFYPKRYEPIFQDLEKEFVRLNFENEIVYILN